ncbi:MAG TPA: hypothetical protein VFK02_13960 [Kofleriaceae bacterium]|nr:hypothetical protein [Kofleriaceae bacterium]
MKKHKQNTGPRALEIKRETVVHLGQLDHGQLKQVVGGSEANSMHPSQCVGERCA